MFTTPPAVYKEPEQIVRKLRLTSTESSGEFKMDGKYNIELCDNESDKCEALMSVNVPAQDTLEKHYYTYFGKTRLIDGKKQTPEKTMEYDDGNTYANRMKEAMLELIQRKVSVEEPAESKVSNETSGVDDLSKMAAKAAANAAKKINQIVNAASSVIAKNNTTGSGSLEEKLKEKIKAKLTDELTKGSGSLEDQLKEKIKEALEKQLTKGSLEDQLKEKIKATLTSTLTSP